MVQPFKRSLKARHRKSPGGKKVTIYKPPRSGKAKCAVCSAKLNAVPSAGVAGMRKLAKTEKRPERKFGGVLCSDCTRQIVKEKIRLQEGTISPAEIDLRHMKYIKALKL